MARLTILTFIIFQAFTPLFASPTEKDSINILINEGSKVFDKDPAKASVLLRKAITKAEAVGDERLMAKAYLEYTHSCYALNEPDEEMLYSIKALELYRKLNDKPGTVQALIRLARTKLNSQTYTDVLSYLYDAKKLAGELKDTLLLSTVYSHMGTAYNWMKYPISAKSPDPQKLFLQYSDSAILYLRRCIKIQTGHDPIKLSVNYNNLGLSLYDRAMRTDKNFAEALEAHKKSMQLKIKYNDPKGLSSSYQEIGKIYFQQKKHNEGISYIKRSIEIADSLAYTPQLEESYLDLTNFYSQIGPTDSALRYQKKYYQMNLKRIGKKNALVLSEMENKYNLRQKETEIETKNKELASQQVQLKLQKRIIIISSLGFLSITVLAGLFYSLFRKNKLLSQKNLILLKEQNHRVKNNLQVISALLSLQANRINNTDAKKAIEDSQLRVQAMGIIHKKLYGENIVDIEMDVFVSELAENVLPVFGLSRDNVNIEIQVDKINLHVEKAIPVGLLLNELLTNSCKYALQENANPTLKIVFRQEHHTCHLSFTDNGPGFDPENDKNKDSFGLKLITLQCRQLNGKHSWSFNQSTNFSLRFDV